MDFLQEVREIFRHPAWSLTRIQERWTASQVSQWLRTPQYQGAIWQAIASNQVRGVKFLEWLEEDGFTMHTCPIIWGFAGGTFKSMLHCVFFNLNYPSPLLLFCVRQARRHCPTLVFWESLLHDRCIRGYDPTAVGELETCMLLLDAGNMTKDTKQCSREKCFSVTMNKLLEHRRTHLRCTLTLLGLRRRVAWVRQCATRDVMAIIGKELWRLRWFDASSFDNVLHHKRGL